MLSGDLLRTDVLLDLHGNSLPLRLEIAYVLTHSHRIVGTTLHSCIIDHNHALASGYATNASDDTGCGDRVFVYFVSCKW